MTDKEKLEKIAELLWHVHLLPIGKKGELQPVWNTSRKEIYTALQKVKAIVHLEINELERKQKEWQETQLGNFEEVKKYSNEVWDYLIGANRPNEKIEKGGIVNGKVEEGERTGEKIIKADEDEFFNKLLGKNKILSKISEEPSLLQCVSGRQIIPNHGLDHIDEKRKDMYVNHIAMDMAIEMKNKGLIHIEEEDDAFGVKISAKMYVVAPKAYNDNDRG